METNDIIQDLRFVSEYPNCYERGYIARIAADEMERLQAENQRLNENIELYASNARVVALHLHRFLNRQLPYAAAIADAARKASEYIEALEMEIAAIKMEKDALFADFNALRKLTNNKCFGCKNNTFDADKDVCNGCEYHDNYDWSGDQR